MISGMSLLEKMMVASDPLFESKSTEELAYTIEWNVLIPLSHQDMSEKFLMAIHIILGFYSIPRTTLCITGWQWMD